MHWEGSVDHSFGVVMHVVSLCLSAGVRVPESLQKDSGVRQKVDQRRGEAEKPAARCQVHVQTSEQIAGAVDLVSDSCVALECGLSVSFVQGKEVPAERTLDRGLTRHDHLT